MHELLAALDGYVERKTGRSPSAERRRVRELRAWLDAQEKTSPSLTAGG